jgi:hypothetical protein
MSSKIKVIVQSPAVIHDSNGQPLLPGQTYNVVRDARIQDFISEGFLTEVISAEEVEEKTETKKAATPTKPQRSQETDSANQ